MKLASQKPGMASKFRDLDKFFVRGDATKYETFFPQDVPIGVVEFITMPMSLGDQLLIVGLHGNGPLFKAAGIEPQPHGPALGRICAPPLEGLFPVDPFLHEIDDGMGRVGIKFRTVGSL